VELEPRGWLVAPAVRSLGGANSSTPYIYQDWVRDTDVLEALMGAYELPQEELRTMGFNARESVIKEHHPNRIVGLWDEMIKTTVASAHSPARYTLTEVRNA
jgi:hypothetical protein